MSTLPHALHCTAQHATQSVTRVTNWCGARHAAASAHAIGGGGTRLATHARIPTSPHHASAQTHHVARAMRDTCHPVGMQCQRCARPVHARSIHSPRQNQNRGVVCVRVYIYYVTRTPHRRRDCTVRTRRLLLLLLTVSLLCAVCCVCADMCTCVHVVDIT